MSDLKAALEKLATDFAAAAVTAIQHASLNDIAGIGRRQSSVARAVHAPRARAPRAARAGRRHRRSAADIGKVTGEIAALLAKHKGGLRAEEIRAELGLPRSELPKPIAEGLKSGKFKKQGQKRATVYFVGGGGAATAKKAKPTKPKATRKAKRSRKAAPKQKRKAASGTRRSARVAKKPASAPKAPAATSPAS